MLSPLRPRPANPARSTPGAPCRIDPGPVSGFPGRIRSQRGEPSRRLTARTRREGNEVSVCWRITGSSVSNGRVVSARKTTASRFQPHWICSGASPRRGDQERVQTVFPVAGSSPAAPHSQTPTRSPSIVPPAAIGRGPAEGVGPVRRTAARRPSGPTTSSFTSAPAAASARTASSDGAEIVSPDASPAAAAGLPGATSVIVHRSPGAASAASAPASAGGAAG